MRKASILALVCVGACGGAAILSGCGGSGGTSQAARTTLRHHRAGERSKSAASPARSLRVRDASPQPGWRPYRGPVPILVYHELGVPPPSDPLPQLYVSDHNFSAEMKWLSRHGYTAVTLDEVMRAWYHGGRLPAKPIVVTFDNGYVPQATFAPAVLSRYGWPGVLNEITEHHLANWRLRHLISLGWEIDSHSLTHPDLTTLPPSELRRQLVASRRFLQHTFHIPVNSFCYPSSRYNATVIAGVKAAGYTNALTENPGFATRSDPYLLDRFEIEGGVSQVAADLSNR